SPVRIEVEAPFPDRGGAGGARRPEVEPATDVEVHIDEVVGERARDGRLVRIGVEDLPVGLEVLETRPVLGSRGARSRLESFGWLDVRQRACSRVQPEQSTPRVLEPVGESEARCALDEVTILMSLDDERGEL